MKTLSQDAICAKAIRADLKKSFPETKFTVRVEHFSCISIGWIDYPVTSEAVKKIVSKYELGSFNGQEDIYEHNNKNENIPQVKYIHTKFEWSEGKREEVKKAICTKFNVWDDQDCKNRFHCWLDQLIWTQTQKMATKI